MMPGLIFHICPGLLAYRDGSCEHCHLHLYFPIKVVKYLAIARAGDEPS